MDSGNPATQPCQAFRKDLTATQQVVGGEEYVIIKEPEEAQYFRFSAVQYEIAQVFDGEISLKGAVKKLNTQGFELTLEELNTFYQSLKSMHLLDKTRDEKHIVLLEKRRAERQFKLLDVKGGIMFMRIPIWDPNTFFDKVIPYMRWIWTKTFVILAVCVMAMACGIVGDNWAAVLAGAEKIYSFQGNGLLTTLVLYSTVLLVIGIHELGHGFTCKNYGGEVHEIGFLFMLFLPCMFANVNDAWTFSEKKHRMYVTSAGVFIEFLVGSIAVFVWYFTSSQSWINSIAYQMMAVCGLSTVLFNFNPLMKLDGYYALCDFLEMPNLKQNSTDYVTYWFKTRIFRKQQDPEQELVGSKTRYVYLIYGVLSIVFMACMLTTMFFVIKGLLFGLFGVIGLLAWFYLGWFLLSKFLKKPVVFLKDTAVEHKEWFLTMYRKCKPVLLGVLVLVILYAIFGRIPERVVVACAVEYDKKEILHAFVDGFIQDVQRTPDTGQIRIAMSNQDLQDDYKRKVVLIAEARTQLLVANDQSDVVGVAKLQRQLSQLEIERKHLEENVSSLVFISAKSGDVDIVTLDELNGKYVKDGEVILTVFDPKKMTAILNVEEQYINSVAVGQEVHFIADSSRVKQVYYGEVERIFQTVKMGDALRTYEVKVVIKNEDASLRNGMKGKAKILIGSTWVPEYLYGLFDKNLSPDIKLRAKNFI